MITVAEKWDRALRDHQSAGDPSVVVTQVVFTIPSGARRPVICRGTRSHSSSGHARRFFFGFSRSWRRAIAHLNHLWHRGDLQRLTSKSGVQGEIVQFLATR